jgi:phospholipid/cholesterol/gamma-HCH transport system substrate-binding protein
VKISKEVKVGLLALVAGVVLYTGFNFLKGVDFFSPVRRYYVVYRNIDGLSTSNPVYLNGLTVGRVNAIQLLTKKNFEILVSIDVDDALDLGDSTKAVLSNSDLLGSKCIVLKLGRNTKVYKNGDTLRGATDKNLTQELTEKAMPILTNLDSTVVKLNRVFGDEMGNSVQKILHNLELASHDLKILMASNKTNINTVTSNFSELSASLVETEKSFKPLLKSLNTFADTLNDLELKKTITSANQAMKNLREVTDKINKGQGSLGAMVNDKAVYDNLNQSIKDLDALLVDVKARPKRYVHFSVFGGGGKKDKKSAKKDSL